MKREKGWFANSKNNTINKILADKSLKLNEETKPIPSNKITPPFTMVNMVAGSKNKKEQPKRTVKYLINPAFTSSVRLKPINGIVERVSNSYIINIVKTSLASANKIANKTARE